MNNSNPTQERYGNSEQAAGIYIHVPFCRRKCSYCDFYSIPDTAHIDPWKDALIKEAIVYRSRFHFIDTIYFGGGTPSLLPVGLINEILSVLKSAYHVLPDAEVTVELNPDDIYTELLHSLRKAGVNRLSIGIQSLNDDVLAFLGRKHTSADALKATRIGRKAGFNNIGIDLMYNIPGQPLDNWISVLEAALDLEPDHISCYELTLEPGTPLANVFVTSTDPRTVSETGRTFFIETSSRIRERGYIHYEVSNFALKHTSRSRHNMKYWNRVPYLGLGPAAHSMQGRERWWNIRDVSRYNDAICASKSAIESSEILTDAQVFLERLYLGFRNAEGIPSSFLFSDPDDTRITYRLIEKGLLQERGDRIIPTDEGYLVADSLPLSYTDKS